MSNRLSLSSGSSYHKFGLRKTTLLFSCVGVLLLAGNTLPQKPKGQPPAPKIPTAATIEIVLLTAPGIDDEGSKWEIAYELRIINEGANEAAYFEARKQGKPEVRVGELIKEADVRKPLRPPENHKFVFEIPLSPEIQERLRNQPREHLQIAPGPITPESYKASREQDALFQIFKFYSVINVYDARLKKNILIPVDQNWSFAKYPNARFGFKIEIDSDGGASWKTSQPANSTSPVMEIRKP
jgi:hypothetical protein